MDVCVCCDFLVCVCVCLVSVVSVVSVCLRACVCVSACQTLAKQRLFLAQTDGIGDLSTLVAAQCGDAHLGHDFPGDSRIQ